MKNKRPFGVFSSLFIASIISSSFSYNALADDIRSQMPGWASEYIGDLDFVLDDDPTYHDQTSFLRTLKAELALAQQSLDEKSSELSAKSAEFTSKQSELTSKQVKLEDDAEELQLSKANIETIKSELETLESQIETAESNIRVKENELITYHNVYDPFVDDLEIAAQDSASKKTSYESKLAECQELGTSGDCSDTDAVLAAKSRWDQAKERVKYFEEQVAHFGQLIGDAEQSITESSQLISSNNSKIIEKNGENEALSSIITSLEESIPALAEELSRLGVDVENLSEVVLEMTGDKETLTAIVSRIEGDVVVEEKNIEDYKNELIQEVLAVNREGLQMAKIHGSQDGMEVASDIGSYEGNKRGTYAGNVKGSRDGQERDFQRGATEGSIEGKSQGGSEGQTAGSNKGHQDGYAEAGQRDGQAAGIVEANNSDAQAVGQREGREAGKQSAVSDGMVNGSKAGEAQAIRDLEAQPLNSTNVAGPFAGTFNNNLPAFPGAQNSYWNTSTEHTKTVLRKAYEAGYTSGYHFSAEESYYNNVDEIYQQVYDVSYDRSYGSAYGQIYEESFRQGYDSSFQKAYSAEYELTYDNSYVISHASALENPDFSSSLYKSTFQTSKASSFSIRYQEIKAHSFEIAKTESYDQNIVGETAKYKAKRITEVESIYRNFPVLKFESNSTVDAGISGIAARDSIYQPGEDFSHDIVVTNYSSKAASGVKVKLNNNVEYRLPSIAGKSKVTISGVAKDNIPYALGIGQRYESKIDVVYKLSSSEKGIQGRHFESISNGIVASKTAGITTKYPMSISSMGLSNPIVINKESNVITSISNESRRSYQGPIQVVLTSSLGDDIILSDYNSVSNIDSGVTINDAKVKVSNMEQVFEEVSFSVEIKKGGVTLGKLNRGITEIVKTPYEAIEGAPVVVLKSSTENARKNAKDVIAELGGSEVVSMLDLDGGADHQSILNKKLAGKTIYIVDDGRNSLVSNLNKMFETENTLVVFVNERNGTNALEEAKANLDNLKYSTALNVDLGTTNVVVHSTSVIRNSNVDTKTSFLELDLRNLDVGKELNDLKLNDSALLEKASELTEESFLNANSDTKTYGKIVLLRGFEDVMSISNGFNNDGGKKDKTYKKRVKDDQSLFFNKLSSKVKSSDKKQAMGAALLATPMFFGMKEAMKDIRTYSDIKFWLKVSLKSALKKGYKEAKKVFRKSNDKKLGKKVEERMNEYYPYSEF